MSKHSKRPELRFASDENNIYALGPQGEWLAVELHANPERIDWQAAEAEMEALGRKMAAAPELVEAVQRLTSVLYSNTAMAMHHDREHQGGFEDCQDRGCRQALEAMALGDAALKKAGVET